MSRPSGVLWDKFYIYLSLLDCLRFLLMLLDEFLYLVEEDVVKLL